MAERGMLFSAPLVQALKAGRKTQTRRPIKDVFCGGNGNGTGRWSFIAASTERGGKAVPHFKRGVA